MDSLDVLDFAAFATMLEGFVNILEKWRGILSNFGSAAADLIADEQQTAKDMRQANFGTFMRV